MKRSLLFMVFMIIAQLSIQAQDWAPIGAKWHYTYIHFFSPEVNYNVVESIGDTTINGQPCRILRSDKVACDIPYDNVNGGAADFYMYDENGKVYFYNQDLNDFTILYDFSAQVGDIWTTQLPTSQFLIAPDPINVQVDSIATISANGQDLKKLYVRYYIGNNPPGPGDPQSYVILVERWGDLMSMFWNFVWPFTICDEEYNQGFRCYEDPEFGFIQYLDIPCDTTYVISSINELSKEIDFSVSPNPTSGELNITLANQNNRILGIQVFALKGQLLKDIQIDTSLSTNNSQLNLEALPEGIFIVKVRTNEGLGIRKVVLVD